MTTPEPQQASPPRGSGASPYSTGGGGTVLEHRYGALLLSHLLSGDPAPELGSDVTVTRVAFQARAESDVDDYMLVGRGGDGNERRAFVAVRRAPRLIPSDSRSVELLATYLPTLLNDWLAVQAGRSRLVLASRTARLGLGTGIVTTRTLRRRYFALAGRLTHSARRWTLHLPSAGPGPGSWQPRSRDYGRYRSRPDARSQRRPESEPRASMPTHASRTRAPSPSAPPSDRSSLRHRPANADTPARLSGSPASRPVTLRSVYSG